MFKKLKALWNVEQTMMRRVQAKLNEASTNVQELLDDQQAQIKTCYNFNNKTRAELAERLSKIEVLFADELKQKEKERDERVRKAQREAMSGKGQT